jgi:two-component system sensor histidine kinase AlgZ
MMFNINGKKWIVMLVIATVTALIPILRTFFELITTNKESVIFLEGYPSSITVLILLYYLLLIILGVAWFIKQITSLIKGKNENRVAAFKKSSEPALLF